ncbi:MAG TPA: putative Ig domain-containing protein [Chryseosolibacter sp.]|nr:putative Ig domain-containing protein [Chryseosolibacter sp.]
MADEFSILFPNVAPVVAIPIPNQSSLGGASFNFVIDENAFVDQNGDALAYTAQLSGGSPLPQWLAFDGTTMTFSGSPAAGDAGAYDILVIASDGEFSVSDVFTYTIIDPTINQSPVVANPIPDINVIAGSPLTFTFAANTFNDPNGDNLNYSASLANNNALPGWLSFDAGTRTFSGSPDEANIGAVQLQVIASDGTLNVSETFMLNVIAPGGVRINSGGPQITAYGVVFDNDKNFTGGATFANNNIADINGTADDQLYRTERYGNFSYQVPVASGEYVVRFHFAEIYFGATGGGAGGVGKRVFNVTGEGLPLLTNFDIFAEAGAMAAVIKEFNITVADGVLNVDFASVAENPKVSAIEIVPFVDPNTPPVIANPIPNATFVAASPFTFAFAANTFTDADGDVLTYTAALSDGSSLPGWLNFDGGSRTFSGTPATTDEGTYQIQVNASDGVASVSDMFALIIEWNETPIVANPIPDQSAETGSPFTFAFAANTFTDADNDPLTFAATLDNGDALPSWLTFVPATRTFGGTPASTDAGALLIKVTASDGKGGTVADSYQLTIGIANSPPVVANAIPDQTATSGSLFTYTFASNTFSDANGDALTYSATLAGGAALPSWLVFSSSSRSFTGTPTSANLGTLIIDVVAADGRGGVASESFQLTVRSAPPAAGTRINAGANSLTLSDGRVFSSDFGYSGGASYTNTSTADITGTIHDALYRSERYNLTGYNLSLASGTYLLTLHFAEIWFGAPGGSTGGAGKRVFNVSAEGVPLLSNFDIYAEAGAMAAVVKEFEITVADGTLNIAFGKVIQNPKVSAIEVVPIALSSNTPPVVANAIPDQNATTGTAFNFTFALNTFTDLNNDALTYSATLSGGSPLPSWLTFTPSTRTFSGTPTTAGAITIAVTASDGKGGSVTDNFQLTTNVANSPPVVANAIPDQTATVGTAFNFAFALNTFSDANGDALSYTATLSGGSPLPSWLTFTPSTRTFSGTPTTAGAITIAVTASDGKGGSVTDNFQLTTNVANSPPVVANAIPDQTATVGTAFNFAFALNTFSDANGDALSYTATLSGGSPLPSWLTFTPSTRTFSGTPTTAGAITIAVTASDGKGGSVADNFQLTTNIANSPPIVANGIPDLLATAGAPFSFTFGVNTFTDPDNDVLTYTATLSGGSPLPSWLSFTSSSRNFSGTPASTNVGAIVIEVTASDGRGGTAKESFQLTVQNATPPAGTRINAGAGSVTLADGRVFAADFGATLGGRYTTTSTMDITGTTDDVIYRSEHFNMTAYTVPVPSGTYLLTLHFAEIWFGAPDGQPGGVGKRVFNVSAEGVPLLTNFDIYALVGAMAAVVRQFEVTVTDGSLNIVFGKVIQNPKISAIEIVPVTSSARLNTAATPQDQLETSLLESQGLELVAFPNPFSTTTTLEYRPTRTGQVALEIVSPQGSIISEVYKGPVEAGNVYQFTFDAADLPHGLYLARIVTGEHARFVKLALTKRP